jgi:hypothetical protein
VKTPLAAGKFFSEAGNHPYHRVRNNPAIRIAQKLYRGTLRTISTSAKKYDAGG